MELVVVLVVVVVPVADAGDGVEDEDGGASAAADAGGGVVAVMGQPLRRDGAFSAQLVSQVLVIFSLNAVNRPPVATRRPDCLGLRSTMAFLARGSKWTGGSLILTLVWPPREANNNK